MRIAQISPLFESVPPKLYGGTERVVAFLTEELVAQGHDVTLFASGDSRTSARLVPCVPKALRLDPRSIEQTSTAPHLLMIHEVLRRADEFDMLHFHTDYIHLPLLHRRPYPSLTTIHSRLDLYDIYPIYNTFRDFPFSSISDAQREPLPFLHWLGTVHHGLPEHDFTFGEGNGGYLAFLGRISPEKHPDTAIDIAIQADMPLKIAAKINDHERDYFSTRIRPFLQYPSIEFLGEINAVEKNAFLRDAYALLFPVQWPEPFGLVMIEAMACGTPVIAYPYGSVTEVIEHGVTGFIVHSVAEAVQALKDVGLLSRARIRKRFEERFTANRMCREYVALYEKIRAAHS